MAEIPGLDALRLAIFPVAGAVEAAGPMYVNVNGTVNIGGGGGGGGGTAMVDNSPFTAGGSSFTPVGGYHGGRTVASGNAAALQIDGSGNLQVNIVAGGGGGGFATAGVFGTVGIYGSPAFPIYNIGSVNVVNPVGIFGSTSVFGSLGVGQIGSPWGVVGSVGVTPLASFTVNLGSVPTVWLGNQLATINVSNFAAGTGFATAAVYGSPAFPVYVLGTLNISNNPTTYPTVGVYGSVSIFGSVNVGNFPGVQVVDTRASLVPTQWIISGSASGQFNVAGTAPESQRIWLSSYHLTTTATCDAQWMSPSGIAISGSLHLLPGNSLIIVGGLNSPVIFGSLNSGLFIRSAGTQNIGGVAVGWVA